MLQMMPTDVSFGPMVMRQQSMSVSSPFDDFIVNDVDANQPDWKSLTSISSNFHSHEVVNRVSETQLQVSENSN